MASQRHVIKRQVVELLGIDKDALHAVQERVAEFCRTQLPAFLDTMFSRLVGPDFFIEIDRLELDLGHLVPSTLDEELPVRMRHALGTVQDRLQAIVAGDGAAGYSSPVSGVDGERFPEGGRKLRAMSRVEADGKLVAHFLATGTLPWWAAGDGTSHPESVLARLLEDTPREVEHRVRPLLVVKSVRERVLVQLGGPLRRRLFDVLLGNGSWTLGFPGLLQSLSRGDSDLSKMIMEADAPWRAALEAASVVSMQGSPELFLREWLKSMLERLPASRPEGAGILRRNILMHISPGGDWKELLLKIIDEELGQRTPLHETAPDTVLRNSVDGSMRRIGKGAERDASHDATRPREQVSAVTGPRESADSGQSTSTADDSALEGLYVNNGGLVLVWPYLGRFFESLGLVADNVFVSGDLRRRAVYVLHYLSHAEEGPGEQDLTLNKVLCGIPWDEPLPRIGSLSEHEKSEAEALLETIVRHWSILKNTSPSGLRRSFLQREGVLRMDRHSWLLQVERKGWDVLLERLPWMISLVKLPWMPNALAVEW